MECLESFPLLVAEIQGACSPAVRINERFFGALGLRQYDRFVLGVVETDFYNWDYLTISKLTAIV